MRAHEIMSRHVVTTTADTPVADAIKTMLAHHISGLPVVDAVGKLVGILSESDFIRRVEIGTEKRHGRWLTLLLGGNRAALDFARQHGRKVGQIMTPAPITIGEDMPLERAVRLMETHNVKRLPVMRGDAIVGIVTRSDFLAAIASASPHLQRYSGGDDQIRSALISVLAAASWRPFGLNVSVHDGIVTLRGTVKSEQARQAAIVAAENIPGVKQVDDQLSKIIYPPPEEDYGGGDIVSPQEEPSTVDDQPL